jgi:hypothetical protein
MERTEQKQTKETLSKKYFDPMRTIKKMKFRLFFVVTLILLNIFVGLNLQAFILLIVLYTIIEGEFISKKKPSEVLKSCFYACISILIFVGVYCGLGWFGIVGMIIFYIIFLAVILYSNKKMYLNGMRSIETRVWGKPLDSKKWKKGELKNTKLKLVWRKTK